MPDASLLKLKNKIKEIDGICFNEPENTESLISFKVLFLRENVDRYGVSAHLLYELCAGVLHLMRELHDREICPGLFDLNDFYADLEEEPAGVLLSHAEKFQFEDKEGDYDWYPEEERIFGDLAFFDRETQLKANERLLFKVLCACSKGNVKIPPAQNESDYSREFYEALPAVLKEHFLARKVWSFEEWESFLSKELCNKVYKHDSLKENDPESGKSLKEGESYDLFVFLRSDLDSALVISRLLFEEMDELSLKRTDVKYCYQAYVYGDRHVMVRPFAVRTLDFRVQLSHKIRPYSAGEALMIAADCMEEKLLDQKDGSIYGLHVIAGQRLSNDRMFQIALDRLSALKNKGVELYLKTTADAGGEAMEKLKNAVS